MGMFSRQDEGAPAVSGKGARFSFIGPEMSVTGDIATGGDLHVDGKIDRAVRFEAEVPEAVEILDCNCSICTMTGFRHLIVPHEDFTLHSAADTLTIYRFGTGAAQHLFCRTCGVKSFYQPRSHPEAWSVNANCLDQLVELAVEQFDGANWEQAKANLDARD